MNTEHFKQRLEEELALVTKELGEVARPDISEGSTEKDEVADQIEEMEVKDEERIALEARKLEVDAALARIEVGTYGKCRECGEDIEEDRLEANPAAATCIAHAA